MPMTSASGPLGSTQANPNANPATISASQVTATASAAALPSQAYVNGPVITNDPDGTVTAYTGPAGSLTTANGYKLKPGQSISYGVQNASAIAVITASGTTTLYVTGS